MVEVCAICDIAGCHHIRSRAAMTDPTPTRAEVERDLLMAVLLGAEYRVDLDWLHKHGMEGATALGKRAAELTIVMRDERDALRERAEAAERDRDEALNQLDSAKHSVDVLRRRITATNAAWNDAIEAADKAAIGRQGRRAMGDGHGNSCYDIGVSDAASAIRALRRAAPTEGEA